MPYQAAYMIADFIIAKARRNMRQAGINQAAKNLKKQGYPVEFAVAILCKGR